MKLRADQLLVNTGLAPSKSAAQKLIEGGQVLLPDGTPVRKPAQGIDDSLQLNVLQELKYVSRGALKLLPAIEKHRPDLEGRTALDLGAVSTGTRYTAGEGIDITDGVISVSYPDGDEVYYGE